MKWFLLRPILLICVAIVLNACESTGEVATDSNAIKTGGAVPGEKSADEPVTPMAAGPGMPSAGVPW